MWSSSTSPCSKPGTCREFFAFKGKSDDDVIREGSRVMSDPKSNDEVALVQWSLVVIALDFYALMFANVCAIVVTILVVRVSLQFIPLLNWRGVTGTVPLETLPILSGSVGGYGSTFLTAEQQERYASIKTKLCRHKAVDVADLQKNGMGSIVAAMDRLNRTRSSSVEAPTAEEVATAPAERAAAPSVEAEAAATSAESSNKIKDIPPEDIEPVGHSSEDIPPSSRVASVLRNVLDSIQDTQEEPVIGGGLVAKDVAPGHTENIIMEEAPSQGEQEIAHDNIIVEDAPIEGEQSLDGQATAQGEHNASAPIDDHPREGLVESASEDTDDVVEPVVRAREDKGKGALSSELESLRKDYDSMRKVLVDLSAFVREHLLSQAPPSCSAGPSGPSEESNRPSGPIIAEQQQDDESRPSGPIIAEQQEEEERPSGPLSENPAGPPGPIHVENEHIEEVVIAEESGPAGPTKDASPPVESVSAQQSKNFSMTEAKTEEQWARSNRDLYNQFRRIQAARYPPREAPLRLSEWFQIHHKNLFGPFIQKEIKFIRHYKMYCDYCYLNSIPEVQLGQFRQAIRALSSRVAHTEPLRVDFATLVIPDVVFLPPLHSLIMDSSVGTLMFERAAQVMARLSVQEGRNLSFYRFVFKQYLQGYFKADILAPILSECERLSPADWEKLYTLSAQQLQELNASQAHSHQPLLTPGDFLDANSLHLVRDSFMKWEERQLLATTNIGISYRIRGSFTSRGWLPPWDPPIALSLEHFKPILKSRNAKRYLSLDAFHLSCETSVPVLEEYIVRSDSEREE
ncbi:hypothetical protein Taro_039656 [Colocasia esculenta]|uniref:Uncharacterized protein n=1 Tax=Colocasia esculenta TaxID=4460 RepID=A0A843WH57_COLES|nr:hypothetical protein [Colocasia esculenta]